MCLRCVHLQVVFAYRVLVCLEFTYVHSGYQCKRVINMYSDYEKCSNCFSFGSLCVIDLIK